MDLSVLLPLLKSTWNTRLITNIHIFVLKNKKKTLIGLTSNLIYYNNKESDFIADNLAYKEMIMMLIKRQAKCLRDHLFGMVGLGLFSRRHLIWKASRICREIVCRFDWLIIRRWAFNFNICLHKSKRAAFKYWFFTCKRWCDFGTNIFHIDFVYSVCGFYFPCTLAFRDSLGFIVCNNITNNDFNFLLELLTWWIERHQNDVDGCVGPKCWFPQYFCLPQWFWCCVNECG